MIELVIYSILPAAYTLLPDELNSRKASAEVITIGLQESRLLARKQQGGPARGLWQFEDHSTSATANVLTHPRTQKLAKQVLERLLYPTDVGPYQVARFLEHNDILAAAFARLQLYTHPRALPGRHEIEEGWNQYLETWHPGRPHPASWPALYREVWDRLEFGRPTKGTYLNA